MGVSIFGEGVATFIGMKSRGYAAAERRSRPRLQGPFPSLVRGRDASGEAFEAEAVLDEISAGGLRLRLARRVWPGAPVFVVASLKLSPGSAASAPRVALRCAVVRSQRLRDGSYLVAAAVLRHRFLDPARHPAARADGAPG